MKTTRTTKHLTETQIQKTIMGYLDVKRILYNRRNNGQFVMDNNSYKKNSSRAVRCNSVNGLSDLEVFIYITKNNNKILTSTVHLEVKTASGTQSKAQKLFHSRMNEGHGFYYVVRSIDDVKEAFEDAKNKIKTLLGNEFDFEFFKAYSMVEKNELKQKKRQK